MADVPQDSTGALSKRPALRPFSGRSREAGQGTLRPFSPSRQIVAPFPTRLGGGTPPEAIAPETITLEAVAPQAIEPEVLSAAAGTLDAAEGESQPGRVTAPSSDALTRNVEIVGLQPPTARIETEDVGAWRDSTEGAGETENFTSAEALEAAGDNAPDEPEAFALETPAGRNDERIDREGVVESAQAPGPDADRVEEIGRTAAASEEGKSLEAAMPSMHSALDTSALLCADDRPTRVDLDAITYGFSAADDDESQTSQCGVADENQTPQPISIMQISTIDDVTATSVDVESPSDESRSTKEGGVVSPVDADGDAQQGNPRAPDAELEAPRAFGKPPVALTSTEAPADPRSELLDSMLAEFELQADERAEAPSPLPGPHLTLRDDSDERTASVLDVTALERVLPTVANVLRTSPPAGDEIETEGLVGLSVQPELSPADEELQAFVSRAQSKAHVVEILETVARRVRAGELIVVADANASPEAVLARVLSSLLSS